MGNLNDLEVRKEPQDILLEGFKGLLVQVKIHISTVSQGHVTASHRKAYIGGQAKVMHQVAGILNTLAVLPTDLVKLCLGERWLRHRNLHRQCQRATRQNQPGWSGRQSLSRCGQGEKAISHPGQDRQQ